MEIRPGLTIACHLKILRTPDGFEPSMKALQAFTYPLGHGGLCLQYFTGCNEALHHRLTDRLKQQHTVLHFHQPEAVVQNSFY